MMTKTLKESLELEAQLNYAFEQKDKAEDVHTRNMWTNETNRILKRLWKLPNYNAAGLMKIQAFLARLNPPTKE